MIRFWQKRKNFTLLKLTAGSLASALLFSMTVPPVAQASVWNERRKSIERMQAKRASEEKPWTAPAREPLAAMEGPYSVPAEMGKTVENFWKKPGSGESAPFIVHVQDAHGYPAAQKNLAKILLKIGNGKEPLLVGSEGAWKEVDLEWLHRYPDAKTLRAFSERMIDAGEMTGEEFAEITEGEGAVDAQGIEDEDLYWKNVAAREAVKKAQQEIVTGNEKNPVNLTALRAKIDALKLKIYPEALLAADRKREAFENDQLNLSGYLAFLKAGSDAAFWEKHASPAVKALAEIAAMEAGLETGRIEKERAELFKTLQEKLAPSSLSQLAELSLKFRLGKVNPSDYYASLLDLAKLHEISAPEIQKYQEYLKASQDINIENVQKDLQEFEIARAAAFEHTNPDAARLARIDRWVRLENNLWTFQMSPEDWKRHERESRLLGWADVKNFLDRKSVEEARFSGADWRRFQQAVDASRNAALQYYRYANLRNEAMVDRLLAEAKKKRRDRVVLVAGGYHTAGMTRILRARNIS